MSRYNNRDRGNNASEQQRPRQQQRFDNKPSRNDKRNKYEDLSDQHSYHKKNRDVKIVPRGLNQEKYLELLKNQSKYIIFAIGPAGTGKTMMAVQWAIQEYKAGNIKKIVITRPAVSVDEEHGFLPGDLNKKMEPWLLPLLDVFHEYYDPREVQNLIDAGVLVIAPLAMMRGRTFKDSLVIADEIQNATPSQMKMLLTRIGEGSRMIVTGDLDQADRPTVNGLLDFNQKYGDGSGTSMIGVIKFTAKDVKRHPVIKEVLSLYKDVD